MKRNTGLKWIKGHLLNLLKSGLPQKVIHIQANLLVYLSIYDFFVNTRG